MDVVVIYNGLGNQMSQYALYLRKKSEGQSVKYICLNTAHNGIELNRLFGINTIMGYKEKLLIILYHILSTDKYSYIFKPIQFVLRYFSFGVLREDDDFSYRNEVVKPSKHLIRFISGGWHNYVYFNDINTIIRNTFQFPPLIEIDNQNILNQSTSEKTVAVHVRRGDYLDSLAFIKFGNICTKEYYEKSISYFEKKLEDPIFYVFSDDMEWSKLLFSGKKAMFVDWNNKENSWKDMALMSCFKNIIIANSTFSWWAAWLGTDNKCDILCPPKFINDTASSIIFPNWWKKVN